MQRALDLAFALAAARLRVVCDVDARHPTRSIAFVRDVAHDVGALEPHLAAGLEAEKLFGRFHRKVLPLDVQLAAEGHAVRAGGCIVRVVLHLDLFGSIRLVVVDHHAQRVEHGHAARGMCVQVLAGTVFQHGGIHDRIRLGHADALKEIAHGGSGIAAAAQAAQRRHARVVPPGDEPLLHEPAEMALAHDRVGQVEPGKLDLPRPVRKAALLHHPVVERAVRLVLKAAQRVGHAFDRILDRMGKVVHRVDAPFVARLMVRDVQNAVHGRVAQVDVGRGHIDLGAQRARAVGKLPVLHALEQVEVFGHAAVAVRAVAPRLRERAAVFAHLVLAEVVHIGNALFDELDGQLVALVEVRRAEQHLIPLEAEPADILLDGVDILRILLGGVGVVEAEVAGTAVPLGHAKVDGQRLGVADVQVAVRLRREARPYARIGLARLAPGLQIRLDLFLDKVPVAGRFLHPRAPPAALNRIQFIIAATGKNVNAPFAIQPAI